MSEVELLSTVSEPKIIELGGKAYSLIVLMKNGFNVPTGFVIKAEAFFSSPKTIRKFLKTLNLSFNAKTLSKKKSAIAPSRNENPQTATNSSEKDPIYKKPRNESGSPEEIRTLVGGSKARYA